MKKKTGILLAVLVLVYGYTTWTLIKRMKKAIWDGRMV